MTPKRPIRPKPLNVAPSAQTTLSTPPRMIQILQYLDAHPQTRVWHETPSEQDLKWFGDRGWLTQ